jgi:hypothetical protein
MSKTTRRYILLSFARKRNTSCASQTTLFRAVPEIFCRRRYTHSHSRRNASRFTHSNRALPCRSNHALTRNDSHRPIQADPKHSNIRVAHQSPLQRLMASRIRPDVLNRLLRDERRHSGEAELHRRPKPSQRQPPFPSTPPSPTPFHSSTSPGRGYPHS